MPYRFSPSFSERNNIKPISFWVFIILFASLFDFRVFALGLRIRGSRFVTRGLFLHREVLGDSNCENIDNIALVFEIRVF